MPSPHAVYGGIASFVAGATPASYVRDERGEVRRVLSRVSWQGVQQLDRVIQETLRERPGMPYEDVLREIRLDGRPLDPSLLLAARQLGEARRQGLLLPGDEAL